jgi:hypothetical protein
MAFGAGLSHVDLIRSLKLLWIDPGYGLLGFRAANIAAAGELPWRLTPIDARVASRIIVDVGLLWLAVQMRRSPKALLTIALSILGFEFLFRSIYTPGLRHEGILLFLIIAVCWMDTAARPPEMRAQTGRRYALGLMPILAFQSLALLVLAARTVNHAESSSKAYGRFLRGHPEYANAILLSEPDYFMEPMPYYVKNRIFMARQNEFSPTVYFDNGTRRRRDLTLGELAARSDSLACASRSIVLMAIGKPQATGRPGEGYVAYHALFHWTGQELRDVSARYRTVADFPRSTSDEIYRVYEVRPEQACARAGRVM